MIKAVLFLCLSLLIGLLSFMRFEFGPITPGQAVSVFRGKLSARDIPETTLVSLAFFVTLAVCVSWLLLVLFERYVRFGFIATTYLQVFIAVLIAASAFELTTSFKLKDVASELDEVGAAETSSVVHVFLEGFGPSDSEGLYADEATDYFFAKFPGQEWGNVKILPGHNNTIMGLVSSWCSTAFPAYLYSDPSSSFYGMREVECIHDNASLSEHDLLFFGGYDSDFQAKSLYFQEKNIEVYDLSTWVWVDPEHLSSWNGGLNDKALLRNASSVLREKLATGDKFYTSILTLDTHKGVALPPYCVRARQVEESPPNNFSCIGPVVEEFMAETLIEQARDHPVLVVLQGDHPPVSEREVGVETVFIWAACFRGGTLFEPERPYPGDFSGIAPWLLLESQACQSAEIGQTK